MILGNLNHHKNRTVRDWCAEHHVELVFTPTYASWANPIEAHFGPRRQFVIANSDYADHRALTARSVRIFGGATRTPATLNCSHSNVNIEPGSAAKPNDGGANHAPKPRKTANVAGRRARPSPKTRSSRLRGIADRATDPGPRPRPSIHLTQQTSTRAKRANLCGQGTSRPRSAQRR